jgi:hypothetical protein
LVVAVVVVAAMDHPVLDLQAEAAVVLVDRHLRHVQVPLELLDKVTLAEIPARTTAVDLVAVVVQPALVALMPVVRITVRLVAQGIQPVLLDQAFATLVVAVVVLDQELLDMDNVAVVMVTRVELAAQARLVPEAVVAVEEVMVAMEDQEW